MSASLPDDPQSTVCFCFGYSVADVRAAAVRAAAEERGNAVFADISDKCRRGLGRCAETNPSGRCCLATVRAVARASGDPSKP